MKKLLLKTSLILATTILFVSCASKKEITEQITKLNGSWQIASITGVKNLDKVFPEQLPTLTFESNEKTMAYGNDGCNNYRTEIIVKKDNQLEVSKNIASTMMACDKVKSVLYMEKFSNANSFSISENVLKLHTPTDTLKFYKISLEGKWTLDKMNTVKKKVSEIYPYKKPFINININSNQITGNTACNNITANFLIYQNTMSFKHVLTTKMFCEGNDEKNFTDALARTTHYELQGTRLILLENKKIILEFKREFE